MALIYESKRMTLMIIYAWNLFLDAPLRAQLRGKSLCRLCGFWYVKQFNSILETNLTIKSIHNWRRLGCVSSWKKRRYLTYFICRIYPNSASAVLLFFAARRQKMHTSVHNISVNTLLAISPTTVGNKLSGDR